MKKKLLVGLLPLFLLECNNTKEYKVKMICNGNESEIVLKENSTFKCELLNQDYEFTVTSISKDKIVIKSDKTGLSIVNENGGISLREKQYEFTINKGKDFELVTQTMDYNESLEIEWR